MASPLLQELCWKSGMEYPGEQGVVQSTFTSLLGRTLEVMIDKRTKTTPMMKIPCFIFSVVTKLTAFWVVVLIKNDNWKPSLLNDTLSNISKESKKLQTSEFTQVCRSRLRLQNSRNDSFNCFNCGLKSNKGSCCNTMVFPPFVFP